ncbi:MAG TPA: alpha/beta fold hydrolase [Acidimicrobiales bacterium]|nr:alpha/beta fold hydrolase [Acidimicrobiales bacterium]
MATFVLVHGAYHGAWCWDRLVPELEARGQRAVAVDLPGDDARADLDDYAAVIVADIDAAVSGRPDDPVVLVGHSLGGLSIPVAASHPAVGRMVFLCSVPTGPGPAIEASMDQMVTPACLAAPRFVDAAGREVLDNASAAALFFHDCPEPDRSWAVARLRPQGRRPFTEPSSLATWPEVAQSVILTADDAVLPLSFAEGAARARLGGADPVILPGSHSPFVSRPGALADALVAEAGRRQVEARMRS